MNNVRARLILLIIFVGLFSFAVGLRAGSALDLASLPKVTINRQVPSDKNLDFSLFWKVWDTVSASYVDKSKVNSAQMVYGAIKGMVSSVGDPYTVFLTPDENKVSQEDLSGNFDGVGIQIGFREGQLAVIAPLPNTPAERAGILAGDYILSIKDVKKKIDKGTSGMTLPEAVQIIRGPRGSAVALTLVREGQDEPKEVTLTRDTIEVPSVVVAFPEEKADVAHLRVLRFGGDTKREWDNAVLEIIKKEGVDKIVLDLRNNPGGYLQAAVDIASDFLTLESVVVIEEEGNGRKHEFKTSEAPRLAKYSVSILVNKGSASASEILAGALRDKNKVKLIGENTFGKGTVQEPQQLEGGAGLHITIAKWLTPNGTWINDKGLPPDVKIEDNPDTTEDEQLLEALKI